MPPIIKSIASGALALAFGYFLMEVFSYGAFWILDGEPFSFSNAKEKLKEVAAPVSSQTPVNQQPTVVHPYLGYVHNPAATKAPPSHADLTINEYGFIDDKEPVMKRSADKYIVAFLGGSVAWWASTEGFEAFQTELKKSPALAGRTIVPVRLALGGYKQPQQLFALLYHISMGAEFDMVVNLDGFNEVTLSPVGNIDKKVHPFYPQFWFELNLDTVDTRVQKRVGLIVLLQELRQRGASIIMRTPLSWSVSANLLWSFTDKFFQSSIAKSSQWIQGYKDVHTDGRYMLSGPNNFTKASLAEDLANFWKRASIQINGVAKNQGFKYLHFLQPNLHLPGTKVLTAEEIDRITDKTKVQRQVVIESYPLLIKKGKELSKKGINFTDLTDLFKNKKESIYIDDCCHVNKQGNEIIGQAMGTAAARVVQE